MADKGPSGGAGGVVKLRWDLAMLYKAKVEAARVKKQVQEIKVATAEVKKEITAGIRGKVREARDLKRNLQDKLRAQGAALMRRARAGVTEDTIGEAGDLSEIGRSLRKGRKGFLDFIGNPVRDIAAGNPAGAIMGLAGELGGPLVKIIAALVTAQVVAVVEAQVADEIAVRVEALSARLEEQRYQTDYQRRLEEEPDFRREEARRMSAEAASDEERLRAAGWGRSSDWMDSF